EEELLALHEALEELARLDARKARILELRFFGGLSIREIARVQEISKATVEREMKMARAWLAQALER
ncbi:MAG: antiterminator Q family protein, partial [Acidobacteriota bacterium]